MKMKALLLALMLGVVFSGKIWAVPDITSVDASQLENEKLVVSGSNFGSSAAEVIMFDQFESNLATQGEVIPLTSPSVGEWSSGSGSTGMNRPLYSEVAHSGQFGAQTYDGRLLAFKLFFERGVQEVFISYWVKLPRGQIFPGKNFPGGKSPETFPTDSSWKFSWLYDKDVRGYSSDLCLPTHVIGGRFYLAGNDYNLDDGAIGTSWWSWNSWIRISVWLRANPSDVTANGDVLFHTVSAEKGVREYKLSKPVFDGDFANGPGEVYEGLPNIQQFSKINFPGWYREETESGTTPIYDDIYVAIGENSITRVELANAADYLKATKVAIQKIESWSEDEIVFDVNTGDLGDISKKATFIFIWDKDGNRNVVGQPVKRYPNPPV